jgi:hypothetical protein
MPCKKKSLCKISEVLTNALCFCKAKGLGVILCSDSNSHTPMLGGVENADHPGEILESLLIDNSLNLMNTRFTPTFAINNRKSFIDFTAVNQFLSTKVSRWRVSEEFNFSDHNSILFSITNDPVVETCRLNYKKCNWELFRKLINKRIGQLMNTHNCSTQAKYDKYAEAFSNIISEARDESSPLFTNKNRNDKPWWTTRLTILHEEVDFLFSRTRAYPHVAEFKQDYRMKKLQYSYEIRKTRKGLWQDLCTEVKNNIETNRLVKQINSEDNPIGFLKNIDDSYTESEAETLSLLLDTHFPKCKPMENLDDEPEIENWVPTKHKTCLVKPSILNK